MKKNKTEYWLLTQQMPEVVNYLRQNKFKVDGSHFMGGVIRVFDGEGKKQGVITAVSSPGRSSFTEMDAREVFGEGINADYRFSIKAETRLEQVIDKFYEREKRASSPRLPFTLRFF